MDLFGFSLKNQIFLSLMTLKECKVLIFIIFCLFWNKIACGIIKVCHFLSCENDCAESTSSCLVFVFVGGYCNFDDHIVDMLPDIGWICLDLWLDQSKSRVYV